MDDAVASPTRRKSVAGKRAALDLDDAVAPAAEEGEALPPVPHPELDPFLTTTSANRIRMT